MPEVGVREEIEKKHWRNSRSDGNVLLQLWLWLLDSVYSQRPLNCTQNC